MFSHTHFELKPIGYVKTSAAGDEVKNMALTSEIIINPELIEALDGLTEFSHLYILFWMHEITQEKRQTLKVHPRGRYDLPLVGVFSVRTNLRPNPFGLAIVEMVKVSGNVVTVRGLDAYDGTLVLDIKSYDYRDVVNAIKVPDWWLKLEGRKT